MDFLSGYNNEKILLRIFFYNACIVCNACNVFFFERKIISLVER